MTIAVSIKVHDGVVLAADSASTLFGSKGVINVYNNANKVFNLYKTLPIGAITYGLGGIGNASISTLMKDLRKRLMGKAPGFDDWKINKDNYLMEDIAQTVRDYYYEDLYLPEYQHRDLKPMLGFIIAGYSSNGDLAEEFRVEIIDGKCSEPKPIRAKEQAGISWGGEGEAISRIVFGFGMKLPDALSEMGIKPEEIQAAVDFLRSRLELEFNPPAMPIQDAIELAEFLVNTTIMFSRFTPGAPTVGGPIEIATITKHEDFKWVKRKHYWEEKYNPREILQFHQDGD